MLSRRGTSLPELVVALALAGVILAAATGSLLRQQRTAALLRAGGRADGQLRTAMALVGGRLALHAADDIVAAEARDSSLQLRAAVAAGVSCDSAAVAGFATDDDGASGGVASPIREGDSLWWHGGTPAAWSGRAVVASWTEWGACAGGDPGGAGLPRHLVRLRHSGADTIPGGAPLRVTRQERLAIYRAGDGTWQLGLREHSAASGTFGAPQPVAGPFLRTAPDGARTGFRYFDAAGAELWLAAEPGAITRLARVRFTAVVPAAGPRAPPVRDSMDVAVRPAAPGG